VEMYKNLDIHDLENEIWKDILDYEGDYQVSNIGRVKSLKFGKKRILKQIKDTHEYFQVYLCKSGISKPKQVNRLVYETFKEKLEEGYVAHHIDEEPEKNFVENLESKERGKHSKDHKKGKYFSEEHKKKISESHKGEKNPNFGKGITNEKIIDIQLDIEKGDLTQKEIGNKYGVSQQTISHIKTGRIKLKFEKEN